MEKSKVRDGVDILRSDLGETGGVPWSLGPQQEIWTLIQICVCICVCAFLRKERPGQRKSQGLINYFVFFF